MRLQILLIATICIAGCVVPDAERDIRTVTVAPNLVVELAEYEEETERILSDGTIASGERFLCVKLTNIDTEMLHAEFDSLTDFLETDEPLKGYVAIRVDVHPSVANEVIVDVLTAAQDRGVRNVSITSCDGYSTRKSSALAHQNSQFS